MLKEKIKGRILSKKLNIALYWAASCGGCEIDVLDTNGKILELRGLPNIVLWAKVIHTRVKDVRARVVGASILRSLMELLDRREQGDGRAST